MYMDTFQLEMLKESAWVKSQQFSTGVWQVEKHLAMEKVFVQFVHQESPNIFLGGGVKISTLDRDAARAILSKLQN